MRTQLLSLVLLLFFSNTVICQKHQFYNRSLANSSDLSQYIDPELYPFYHGVASGDPLSDRVIIWTRVTPENGSSVSVDWKICTDVNLTQVVNSGTVLTGEQQDFTVKIDVTGLQPGTTYYYGFSTLGRNSLTGRTKTAPSDANNLKFAVVSCSNFQHGYFSAYKYISERNDLNAVIHLGDYIYEYEAGEFSSDEVNRPHVPENEMVSLDDYRVRHSLYKLDPDLRAVHQQHPFITVWDDHEFANDAFKDGAQNHQPDTEGPWDERKNNAWKSYFEWMPIRENSKSPNSIYRKIQYGNLVDLIMLDTRIEDRDEQGSGFLAKQEQNIAIADIRQMEKDGMFDEEGYELLVSKNLGTILDLDLLSKQEVSTIIKTVSKWATLEPSEIQKLKNSDEFRRIFRLIRKSIRHSERERALENKSSNRKLLGEVQFQWLEDQLDQSQARWKIIANQVLFTPLEGVPLADAWDGYDDERERLLDFIIDNRIKNTVFLTGDIHTTLASDVPSSTFWYIFSNNSKAVEFVTPSVTSDNLNEFVGISDGFLNFLLNVSNPHFKNSNLVDHGYMVVSVDNSKVQSDWYYINDITTQNSGQRRGGSWYVENNKQRLKQANGPASRTFEGQPAPSTIENTYSFDNQGFALLSLYPNPMKQGTKMALNYFLSHEQDVEIKIYNLSGALVGDLRFEKQSAGSHLIELETEDLAKGTYILYTNHGSRKFEVK